MCGTYWTLSHCWGDGDFLQLKSATQASLLSGVPVEELPPTFQDAIHICREWNVRYIWIDSFCILQDDSADWLEQSADMGKIYSLAHCNICADACTSSKESILRKRNIASLPLIVEISSHSSRVTPGKYDLLSPSYHMELISNSPAHKRAWILQERYLARRVLHFTEREIVWECRSLTASERFPSGILASHSSWIKLFGHWTDESTVQQYLQRRWADIVALYSSAMLTFSYDRPIAIAGVAKLFQELLDDK